MAIQVVNDVNVIRIINGAYALLVHKAQIRTIDTVQNDTIRIDLGEGALHHVYIKYSDVNEPLLSDVNALRDAIKNMLPQEINIAGGVGGDATAANQLVQINTLREMGETLIGIKDTLAWISNDVYNNPARIDESVPNIVYYGYAQPGTRPEEDKWAIKKVTRNAELFVYEWANGAQTFVNIWDRRYNLSYQIV